MLASPTSFPFEAGATRVVRPSETLTTVEPLRVRFGITRLADVTGLDRIGIPTFQAVRPQSRSLSVSQGKGQTADEARVSALMESIEVAVTEHPPIVGRLATVDEMHAWGEPMCDLDSLPRRRAEPVPGDIAIIWALGHDLFADEPRWVPFELVTTDYATPRPQGFGLFSASTNGLASGNVRDEALVHALCEVVERDATVRWERNGGRAWHERRVNLSTIDDSGCRALLGRFRDAGIEVSVWDATAEVDLPVFTCQVAEQEDDPLRLLPAAFGAGCHPRREIALSRALTEAAQSRLTMIAGARDDMGWRSYRSTRGRATLEGLRKERACVPTRHFACAPHAHHQDVGDSLAHVLERLLEAGLGSAVLVDLGVGLPISVVRVVVPGLEADVLTRAPTTNASRS